MLSYRNENVALVYQDETLSYGEEDHESIDDSLEEQHVGPSMVKFSELKDDKQIVKSAAQNERYNLVERPKFLISFDLKEQEYRFYASILQDNASTEIFQQVSKAIFDLVVTEALCWMVLNEDEIYIYIIVFFAVLLLEGLVLYNIYRIVNNYFMVWITIQFIGVVYTMFIFMLNGLKFQSLLLKNTQQATFAVFQTIMFITRILPFRAFLFAQLLLLAALAQNLYTFKNEDVINLQTFIIDMLQNAVYGFLLCIASYNREMKVRKYYNAKRIVEVEINKTEDLLSKLVPQHVLVGIKNDQKVVD